MTELLTPTKNGTRELAAAEIRVTTTLAAATKPRNSVVSRRVLVVVDDACTNPEVCASVRAYADGLPIDALVLAPAHSTAATQWYVDEDAARADAAHRVRICIGCLAQDGIRATGKLGDPDPVRAIADALYDFPADEILLVTAPQRPSRWLSQNIIDRARRVFQEPITHVVMPAASERSTL